jgi:hypothetical protein
LRRWHWIYGEISGAPGDRFVGCAQPRLSAWLDRKEARLVGSTPDARSFGLEERGKPFHFLLLLWCGDTGAEVLHAGLVARQGRGVLVGGKQDAGKSTVTLSCTLGGFSYLGDDYIPLEEGYFGNSLYAAAWLGDNLKRWPQLQKGALHDRSRPGQKSLVLLKRAGLAPAMARQVPIHHILLPRTRAGPSSLEPASPQEALDALSPTSLARLPNAGLSSQARLYDLTSSLPCWHLNLGDDWNAIAYLVEEALCR